MQHSEENEESKFPSGNEKNETNAANVTDPMHQGGLVSLLLIEEFLLRYRLTDTAKMLRDEFARLHSTNQFPDVSLWAQIQGICCKLFSTKEVSVDNLNTTTLDKMIHHLLQSATDTKHHERGKKNTNNLISVVVSPKKSLQLSDLGADKLFPVKATYDANSSKTFEYPVSNVAPQEIDVKVSGEEVDASHDLSTYNVKVSVPSARRRSRHSSNKRIRGITESKPRRSVQAKSSKILQEAKSTLKKYTSTTSASSNSDDRGLILANESQLRRDLYASRAMERELRKIADEHRFGPGNPQRKSSDNTSTDRKQFNQHDEHSHALTMERLGSSKRMECALCRFEHLHVNLPCQVSFKCIIEVHQKWSYEPPDRGTNPYYRPPLCYNAVLVCRMCAQIIQHHTGKSGTVEEMVSPLRSTCNTRQTKSMSSLANHVGQANQRKHSPTTERKFVTDPFSLPPLVGDECDNTTEEDLVEERQRRPRKSSFGLDQSMHPRFVESSAKVIVYEPQSKAAEFMTPKEWGLIKSTRSLIRSSVEESTQQQTSDKNR